MHSPLGGRILHLMSPSYCCISVKPSVTISGCPMGIFPVLLIYGENDTLRNFVQQSEMINPLEPRDAFYGGRTEAFTLFQKDQDISYVDATSLYPYINKTGKIPIGHHHFFSMVRWYRSPMVIPLTGFTVLAL
jgi:hypothetical protein